MEIDNRINNTHDKGALASVDGSVSHRRVTAFNIAERQLKGSLTYKGQEGKCHSQGRLLLKEGSI